jgi:proteasome lid subunit RPN8/RPN11
MERITLKGSQIQHMIEHIRAFLPEEACGMLGGREEKALAILPISNQAHSPVRYYMDPVEMVNGFHWMEEQDMDLIGTFHSHPKGPAYPSETDIREFMYPGTAVIIISPDDEDSWQVQAFLIRENTYSKIPINLLNEQ